MALVASVDYPGRRIYLSAQTIDADLDTLDVYREVRGLRRTTEAHRRFLPMIVGGGNITKIPGISATAAYVQLLYGCRIVPFDATHRLRLIRDTFTDDGLAGADCFDRTPLSPAVQVDIDVEFPAIEIRTIDSTTGGAVLNAELEPGISVKGALRLMLALAAGEVTESGGFATVKRAGGTKTRLTATVDGSSRTGITLDATDA